MGLKDQREVVEPQSYRSVGNEHVDDFGLTHSDHGFEDVPCHRFLFHDEPDGGPCALCLVQHLEDPERETGPLLRQVPCSHQHDQSQSQSLSDYGS